MKRGESSSKKKLSIYEEYHVNCHLEATEKKFKVVPLNVLNKGQRKVLSLVEKYLDSNEQLLVLVVGEAGSGSNCESLLKLKFQKYTFSFFIKR